MNPNQFFDFIRASGLFGGKLTQGVVDTLNVIVNRYYMDYLYDISSEHLAYVLATAYHESYSQWKNPDWLPVREGFAKTNTGAIGAVTSLYNKGIISRNYALPDPVTGQSYYGRGFVQITWRDNYERMGERIGVDLVNNPDKALDRDVAAKLLVVGMVEGLYTGKSIKDYGSDVFDAHNARRIINGLDKAELIKGYYEIFHTAISSSANA